VDQRTHIRPIAAVIAGTFLILTFTVLANRRWSNAW